MGEPSIALVHYGGLFAAALEAVFVKAGLSFQSFNAGSTETQRQLEQAHPAVVVLNGSSERVSQVLTIRHLFRLCPDTAILQVWPDERPIEIHRTPRSRVRHRGPLVELIREIASLPGQAE